MKRCEECCWGLFHTHENHHPSVTLYNGSSYPDAAVWWRDRAKEQAQEANYLRQELKEIKESKAYKLAKWFIRRYYG